MKNKTILLFGGSFNPIHTSHFKIVESVFKRLNQETMLVDEAWLLVAAQNPDKPSEGMAPYYDRVKMCELQTVEHKDWLKVSTFEGGLEPPYDTYTVLTKLQGFYPHYQFVWMMGSDNLISFHTWENWENILENFPVVAVNRDCSAHLVETSPTLNEYAQFIYLEDSKFLDLPNIRFVDAGLNAGRATHIREAISSGKSSDDLHLDVFKYIKIENLYR